MQLIGFEMLSTEANAENNENSASRSFSSCVSAHDAKSMMEISEREREREREREDGSEREREKERERGWEEGRESC